MNPFVWDLWQYTTANFESPVTSITGCPIIYTITDVDPERTVIPSTNLIVLTNVSNVNGANSVVGVWRGDSG